MQFASTAEREQFITANMKLVYSRVYKFCGKCDEDMAQEGFIALVLAADRYNPDNGNSFGAYAVKYIDGYILTHIAKNTLIKPHRGQRDSKYGAHKSICSLSEPVSEASTLTLSDVIASDDDPENEAIGRAYASHLMRILKKREKKALLMYIGGMKQNDIAKEFGVSKSMVSRYILNAKRKIMDEIEMRERRAKSVDKIRQERTD